MSPSNNNEITEVVRRSLRRYLRELGSEMPQPLYPLLLTNVERPLLEEIMRHTSGNQSLAAQMLGINRNTLRRKLAEYHIS